MRTILRLALPILLLIVGGMALGGCVYFPSFGMGGSGKDASALVGDAGSGRPVRVDAATIEDVVRLLGPPQYADADGRRLGYTWTRTHGLMVGLCNGVDKQHWLLVLGFDEHGKLWSSRVQTSRTNYYVGIVPLTGDWMAKFEHLGPTPPGWTPPPAGATRPAATRPAWLPGLPIDGGTPAPP